MDSTPKLSGPPSFSSIAAKVRMGKKVEKALSKDKNHSSASQYTTDDDPNKTPEPHKCTGNFQNDFTEMCRRINLAVIPPVVLRPRPPASVAHDSKPDKGGSKGKQAAHEPEPEPELNEDGELIEPPPKTYTMKEKFDYFKPSVQVEMDHPDKGDTVTEVYVRGWKIDMAMMGIFQMCWPAMDKLHTLNLWGVGLNGETLQLMASFLHLCVNLKNVILDGNTVEEENFSSLIGHDSTIQNLSLRYCAITKKGAQGIGMALGTAKAANTKLLSLNLSGNHIDDEGAEYIARGLKMNRSLLSLSLNSNKIGDKGATKIAEALSRFPLSHDEVVERRRQLSDKGSPDRFGKSPSPSRREGSKDRPASVRSSGTHADKDKKGTRDKPSAKNKKDPKAKDAKEDTKGTKKDKEDTRGGTKTRGGVPGTQSQASMAADSGKTIGGKSKKPNDGKKKTNIQDNEVDTPEVINPLLEVADLIDGQLWVAGNRILINLNLARNKIDEGGVTALLKAMQYQTTLTMDSRNSGSGLMRLCLHRNAVGRESLTLKKLNDHMTPKDPFYKPPPSPEGETA
ncbi:leucine-rich repeat-containing protein 71-like isoform X2 [Littorina saxatilis]|uniref:leucine-rich repeat-containing protein 71-like isoform X2 n=1 Tax=Littorina saxatilis TaxID=31220 RepID=UPI0038B5740A